MMMLVMMVKVAVLRIDVVITWIIDVVMMMTAFAHGDRNVQVEW